MRDLGVACCPCFETLASLAPQHEVVVFQQVRPHPRVTASPLSLEEATNGSRECAPDDRLRGLSKDGLQYRFVIPATRRGSAGFDAAMLNQSCRLSSPRWLRGTPLVANACVFCCSSSRRRSRVAARLGICAASSASRCARSA